MIEIAGYRVLAKRMPSLDEDRKDFSAYKAKFAAQLEKIAEYVRAQAEAYKVVGDGYSLGSDRGDAHLNIETDARSGSLQIGSTEGFRKFLINHPHEDIQAIEAPCGHQYLAFAGFVPVAKQYSGYGSVPSMLADDFWRASYGIEPGRALTQGEIEARAAMHEAAFEKLKTVLAGWKKYSPNAAIELQEKRPGSYFTRITPKDLEKPSGTIYNLTSEFSRLQNDQLFAAFFSGPSLYPSEITAMRAAKEQAERERLEKEKAAATLKPKTLEL